MSFATITSDHTHAITTLVGRMKTWDITLDTISLLCGGVGVPVKEKVSVKEKVYFYTNQSMYRFTIQ